MSDNKLLNISFNNIQGLSNASVDEKKHFILQNDNRGIYWPKCGVLINVDKLIKLNSICNKIKSVTIEKDKLIIVLQGSKHITIPLSKYPKLQTLLTHAKTQCVISQDGLSVE